MLNGKKFVTVFGSSIPKPGEPEYETAYQLAKYFANHKINVCSGGFHGIMDAVSKGALDNGAEAVGVTLDLYNALPSKYLTKQIVAHSLFERLTQLIEIGDAYVVLQGGTGTLLELALVWELMNKGLLNDKPFACHNSLWKKVVAVMEEQILKEKRKTGIIKCFDDIGDCAEFIVSKLKND